jgi:hypothetical protein
MSTILVIDKTGTIKETTIKQFNEAELYKKAGFKSSENFKCHTIWNIELNNAKYSVSLFGKLEGKANQENKYDFPPPVDNLLFFGSCILINKTDNVLASLKESDWEKIYEKLFGGFEELGDVDSSEDEDDDNSLSITKEGYAKDGFIVDDGDSDGYDYDSENEEVSEDEKPKNKGKPKCKLPIAVIIQNDIEYLNCNSELSEEEYFE